MCGRLTGYVGSRRQQSPSQQDMGTAVRTAKTSPASWDAFSDVDAFVDEILMELATMEADGAKPTRSGPKPALAGAALRKAIMAIWCLCFCGMQWRAIGQLCDNPIPRKEDCLNNPAHCENHLWLPTTFRRPFRRALSGFPSSVTTISTGLTC